MRERSAEQHDRWDPRQPQAHRRVGRRRATDHDQRGLPRPRRERLDERVTVVVRNVRTETHSPRLPRRADLWRPATRRRRFPRPPNREPARTTARRWSRTSHNRQHAPYGIQYTRGAPARKHQVILGHWTFSVRGRSLYRNFSVRSRAVAALVYWSWNSRELLPVRTTCVLAELGRVLLWPHLRTSRPPMMKGFAWGVVLVMGAGVSACATDEAESTADITEMLSLTTTASPTACRSPTRPAPRRRSARRGRSISTTSSSRTSAPTAAAA